MKVAGFWDQKMARRQLQAEMDDALVYHRCERFAELCQIEVVLRIFQPGNFISLVANHRCKKGTVLGYNRSKTGLWRMAILLYPSGPVRHLRIDPRSYDGEISACKEPERERVYLYESLLWSKNTRVALIVDKKAV